MMACLRHPSPALTVPGFSNCLICKDVLHVAYRGFGPDFIASALIDCFGKGKTLNDAFELASSWAAYRGVQLSIDDFWFSDDKYPSLNAKGWDIKLLSQWFASWLPDCATSPMYGLGMNVLVKERVNLRAEQNRTSF